MCAGGPSACEYGNILPPQLWRPEALSRFVAWRVGQIEKEPGLDFARREPQWTEEKIREHHAGDPGFEPLLQKIKTVIH